MKPTNFDIPKLRTLAAKIRYYTAMEEQWEKEWAIKFACNKHKDFSGPITCDVCLIGNYGKSFIRTERTAAKAEGIAEERERWIHQPANEHDNKIRRELLETILREDVPNPGMRTSGNTLYGDDTYSRLEARLKELANNKDATPQREIAS